MPRCHISLGGNSGTVAETFGRAIDRLGKNAGCSVVALSRFHQTAPVGDQAGDRFLNAAAELQTSLDPMELLDLLQLIERELGRVRTVHWGPRTLDLDLLYYGSQIIDSTRLIVPHPAAWYRRFVLDPLVEIAPDLEHPVKQATMRVLRERLLARPLPVGLAGGDTATKTEVLPALGELFTDVQFSDWDQLRSGTEEPALILWLGQSRQANEPLSQTYERLPLVARLDVSAAGESLFDDMRHVVQAALGL
jgi:2-amino-4-hydroxy-6-hydroxymethyldihydropteridine diphosphokinase